MFFFKKNKPQITLLVAYTKNGRVTGKNGVIPWQLKSERDRFKEICQGKKIIMGRKTFEEIGHALPYCTIIILSKKMRSVPIGCLKARNLRTAIKLCGDEVLIAGGQKIYEQTLPKADKIYATEILKDFDGDTFFPELNSDWIKTEKELREENGIKYQYVEFTRKIHV